MVPAGRCLITYEDCDGHYSKRGLRQLASGLGSLAALDYDSAGLRRQAAVQAGKMSIQGLQPKLSAVLEVSKGRFALVETGGRFILKPRPELYPSAPENEDLTLHLASAFGIEVPVHGLVRTRKDELCLFTRRFDRVGQRSKLALEDFAQLTGENRDTKYTSSMEKVAGVVEQYCTFPLPEKLKLFRRVLFCFVVGNEDMHLKNWSLITQDDLVQLSPAYDLLNSTILLPGTSEETALPIRGRKSNLTASDIVDYYGMERLGLPERAIEDELRNLNAVQARWGELIERSFTAPNVQDDYRAVVRDRLSRLGI